MERGGTRSPDVAGGGAAYGSATPVRPDLVLAAVAGTFAVTGLVAVGGLRGELPLHAFLFQGFMHVGLALVVLVGGGYLHRSDLPPFTWWSVLGGYLGGICFIAALLGWASLTEILAGGALRGLWDEFVFFGNLGGLFGFLAGLGRARSRYNQQLLADLEARQLELERQNERLDEFASVVSHDLRNPLTVAKGRLELLGEESDSEHLPAAMDALERMETLIDDLLVLARAGEVLEDHEPVGVGDHVQRCWRNVETDGADLVVESDATLLSNETRLAQLFENLFRNAVEHGGEGVTVRVGDLEDGFYVEDDGPGIPEAERDEVLRAGYTTSPGGNGFGLSIVSKIAESQGWDVTLTDSDAGGARFEFRGVEIEPTRPTSETP